MPKKDKKRKEEQVYDLIGIAGVTGLGIAGASQLHVLLGITTVFELYEACKRGDVSCLPGWGRAREAKLKNTIEISILWFQSQCKREERKLEELKEKNKPKNKKSIGFNSELLKEIALAYAEVE